MFLCSYCGSEITEVSMKFMTETPRWNFQDKFVCDLYRFTVTPTLYEVPIFCVVFFFCKRKAPILRKLEGHMFEADWPHICNTGHILVTLICKKCCYCVDPRPAQGYFVLLYLIVLISIGEISISALVPHSSDKHRWDIHQCPSAS